MFAWTRRLFATWTEFFEYLVFPSWVLALAAPESPTALALAGVAVDLVAPDDVDRITTILTARMQAFLRGERPGPIAGRERLSRASQARILFDELDRLLGPRASG